MHEYRYTIKVEDMPNGWVFERVESRGYDSPDCTIEGRHPLYPTVKIGTGRRPISELDKSKITSAIHKIMAPDISYNQWINIGKKNGWYR